MDNNKTIEKMKSIYFIGIGGIGMSGIAFFLKELGYIISGSDVKDSSIIERLRKDQILVDIGHGITDFKDVDLVVCSSAISDINIDT